MSPTPPPSPHERLAGFFQAVELGAWRWRLLEGAGLALLGVGCLLAVALAPAGAPAPLETILIAAGAVTLLAAFRAEQNPAFAGSILLALIAFAAGLQLLWNLFEAETSLGLILASYFALRGTVTIVLAAACRRQGIAQWEWLTVSGVTSLILTLLILSGLPGPYLWMFGVLLGVDLLFDGSALIAVASQANRADASAPDAQDAPMRVQTASPSRV